MKKIFALFMVMALTACGANLDLDRYETSGAGNVNTVSEGVITNVRPVTIATEDGEVGQLAGGIVGGVAGSMVSDNALAQTIGTVGGAVLGGELGGKAQAVLGGYLGGKAQEGLSMQRGMEYIVKLDSGKSVTLTQGDDVVFSVGQRVYVLDADYDERARIIAQ